MVCPGGDGFHSVQPTPTRYYALLRATRSYALRATRSPPQRAFAKPLCCVADFTQQLVGRFVTVPSLQRTTSPCYVLRGARETATEISVTVLLTIVSFLVTSVPNLAHVRDAIARVLSIGGASAVPACGPTQSAPGRLRASDVRHYDRSVRCSLDWDRSGRVTPATTASGSAPGRGNVTDRRSGHVPGNLAWSRAPRAKARDSEPRWNADRRACCASARGRASCTAGWCKRLSAFRIPFFRSFSQASLPGLTRQSMRQ